MCVCVCVCLVCVYVKEEGLSGEGGREGGREGGKEGRRLNDFNCTHLITGPIAHT